MLDYIFQKAFRVVTIMVVMMSTMLTVILIREVELNLVTDGLDSIFHQPECSSWQAEYTEIGTENGESSLWSIITIVIIMVITRVIIMVIIVVFMVIILVIVRYCLVDPKWPLGSGRWSTSSAEYCYSLTSSPLCSHINVMISVPISRVLRGQDNAREAGGTDLSDLHTG